MSNNSSVSIPEPPHYSLSTLAMRGGIWSAISLLTTSLSSLATMVVLARLLSPEEYGLIGFLLPFTLLVTLVGELGLSAAIIQRAELQEMDLHTAFWANVVMGFGLCVLTIILAPLVGVFFKNSGFTPLLSLASLSFALNGLSAVHRALLTKTLAFQRLAIPEMAASIGFMVLTIILALIGLGAFSMACGLVFRMLLQSVLLWGVNAWRPRLCWSYTAFKKLVGFGFQVVITNLLNGINTNIDYMVIGRTQSVTALGFYTLAYQLMSFPRQGLLPIVTRVAFPTFSLLQQDNRTLRRAYCQMVSMIALAIFPVFSLLMVVAPSLIRVIYGEKWTPAILPLQLLCVAGALFSVGSTVSAVFQAKGRADIGVKQNIVAFFALGSFVLAGSKFGVPGVAAAISAYVLIFFPIFQTWTNRLIDLGFIEFLESLKPAAIGSLFVISVALMMQMVVNRLWGMSDVYTLIMATASGIFSYLGYLLLLQRQLLFSLVGQLLGALTLQR